MVCVVGYCLGTSLGLVSPDPRHGVLVCVYMLLYMETWGILGAYFPQR